MKTKEPLNRCEEKCLEREEMGCVCGVYHTPKNSQPSLTCLSSDSLVISQIMKFGITLNLGIS